MFLQIIMTELYWAISVNSSAAFLVKSSGSVMPRLILISEGCTHHRQCGDIGTVKLPKWIREYTGTEPEFVFTSGTEFPDELAGYHLIVHCGGCMLNEREMKYRMKCAQDQGIPMTNYGITIAYIHGILRRSVEPFPEIAALLDGSREG